MVLGSADNIHHILSRVQAALKPVVHALPVPAGQGVVCENREVLMTRWLDVAVQKGFQWWNTWNYMKIYRNTLWDRNNWETWHMYKNSMNECCLETKNTWNRCIIIHRLGQESPCHLSVVRLRFNATGHSSSAQFSCQSLQSKDHRGSWGCAMLAGLSQTKSSRQINLNTRHFSHVRFPTYVTLQTYDHSHAKCFFYTIS